MILIIPDHNNNSLDSSVYNIIEASATLELEIHLLIIGYNTNNVVLEAVSISKISKVIVSDAFHLNDFLAENYSLQILKVVYSGRYSHIIFSNSTFAKSVAPRVAAILDVSPISEVCKIVSKEVFLRYMYAGNILATVRSTDNIKIITLKLSSFPYVRSFNSAKEGSVIIENIIPDRDINLSKLKIRNINSDNRPNLLDAKVIVAGGRALGSKENFDNLLGVLADKIGAAIGASRAAVEAGYASNDLQIGQTGKSISPKLYIAIGISGAPQHVAGIMSSDTIIAINNDKDAPIFKVSDYGILGDLFEVVPKLIKLL